MAKRKSEIDICSILRDDVWRTLKHACVPFAEPESFGEWIDAVSRAVTIKSYPKRFLGYDGFYCLQMSISLINFTAPHLLPLLHETEVAIPLSLVCGGAYKSYPTFFAGPCTLIPSSRILSGFTLNQSFAIAQKRIQTEGARWACMTLEGDSPLEILSIRPSNVRNLILALAFTLDPCLSKRSTWYEDTNPKKHSLELVSVLNSDAVYEFILLLSNLSADTDQTRKIKRQLQILNITIPDFEVKWRPMPNMFTWAGHIPFRVRNNKSVAALYLVKHGSVDEELIKKSFTGHCFNAWNTKQSESGTSIDGPDLISYMTNTDSLNADAATFLGIKSNKLIPLPPSPIEHIIKNEKSRQIYDSIFGKITDVEKVRKKCLELRRQLTRDKIIEFEKEDWYPGILRPDPDTNHARFLGIEEINGVWYCDWVRVFLGDWHNVAFTTELCVLKTNWGRHGESIKDQVHLLRLPLNWQKLSVWEATLQEQAKAFELIASI